MRVRATNKQSIGQEEGEGEEKKIPQIDEVYSLCTLRDET